MAGLKSCYGAVEVVHGEGDRWKAGRSRLLGWNGATGQDGQGCPSDIEMRALAVVRRKRQADDISIEVGRSWNVLSP